MTATTGSTAPRDMRWQTRHTPLRRTSLFGGAGARLAADLVVLALALLAAQGEWPAAFAARAIHWHDLAWLFAATATAWLGVAALLDPGGAERPRRSPPEEAPATALLSLGPIAVIALARWWSGSVAAVPNPLAYALFLPPAALVLRLAIGRSVQAGALRKELLLVGGGVLASSTREVFAASGAAFCRQLGDPRELEGALRAAPVDEVIIALDPLRQEVEAQEAVRVCETLGVPFALPAWTLRLAHARPELRHDVGDGYLHFAEIDPKSQARFDYKHAFDLLASATGLLLLSPLFAAVALAIKLEDGGPVLFRQKRVGLRGRVFDMLKFRSMVVDAEARRASLQQANELEGPVFKIARDPRVTRIGRFIRAYSIDELPQLVNVLRGEMSLVGPRPPLPAEVAQYETWQLRRLSVRPGLTCIWQVSGRSHIGFREWMLLDLRYIDTWRLRDDLALIAKTVPAVLLARGAH